MLTAETRRAIRARIADSVGRGRASRLAAVLARMQALHGTHDQSDHGNWIDGSRMTPNMEELGPFNPYKPSAEKTPMPGQTKVSSLKNSQETTKQISAMSATYWEGIDDAERSRIRGLAKSVSKYSKPASNNLLAKLDRFDDMRKNPSHLSGFNPAGMSAREQVAALAKRVGFHGTHNQKDHGNGQRDVRDIDDDFDGPTRDENASRRLELERMLDEDGISESEFDELKQLSALELIENIQKRVTELRRKRESGQTLTPAEQAEDRRLARDYARWEDGEDISGLGEYDEQ